MTARSQSGALSSDGPAGVCAGCLQEVQADWTYCPYCGAQERLAAPCEICGLAECIGNCAEGEARD
jgi:rRNA maturation endonuclease Nob1